MPGVGIVYSIGVGLLIGWISSVVVSRRRGPIANLVAGGVGGAVGGWLADVFGFAALGAWTSLLAATIGAVILLFLASLSPSAAQRLRKPPPSA